MSGYKGKHRKRPERKATKLAAVGALAIAPLALTSSANAADWDQLAQCESSGNWSINTGNGFSGGLQFTPSTWKAYGGTQYASNAQQASREAQISVAEKVLADQGSGAWPACSKKTDWESGNSSESVVASTKSSARTKTSSSQANSAVNVSATHSHVVNQGDTLSDIAAESDVSLEAVISANPSTVSNPALIYPGQTVTIPK